jgi:hypothetical protein
VEPPHKISASPPFAILIAAIVLCGCHSVAKTHHGRLERIWRVGDEIAEISERLRDIEQTMLYVGRIRDVPLADAALDVAIAIHGAPDDAEKRHAETITAEDIKNTGVAVADLLRKRAHLEEISAAERRKATDESLSLYAMESKYQSLQRLVFGVSLAIGVAVVLCCVRRFF